MAAACPSAPPRCTVGGWKSLRNHFESDYVTGDYVTPSPVNIFHDITTSDTWQLCHNTAATLVDCIKTDTDTRYQRKTKLWSTENRVLMKVPMAL